MVLTQIRLSRQALDLSLSTAKIADLAVTTAKINDLAVTTGKINDLAVTTGKINGGAVTIDKLSDFRPTDAGGLDVAVAAGKIRNNNVVTTYAGGTIAVADDDTSYIEVSSAGSVTTNTTGFTAGRFPIATVVAASGDITSVTDDRAWANIVDNSSSGTIVIREVPTGTINGTNDVFTLANPPTAGSEEVYLNGVLLQSGGEDYAISSATITFVAGAIPQTGDRLLVSYRY